MPRRALPWDTEETEKKPKQKKASPPPRRKEPTANSGDDLVDSDLNPIHPPSPEPKKPKERPDRSPSTSPAPAPPAVVYMREGYAADDAWRMVEDEFYTTAQTFTQHIHRAEYVRLRKLACSRGAHVLKGVTHGTDGRTKKSDEVRLKGEVEERAQKRREVVGGESSEEEDEDEYMHDPLLAVLMTKDKGMARDLVSVRRGRAKTRAAAGFEQSPRNVERRRDLVGERETSPPRFDLAKARRPAGGEAAKQERYRQEPPRQEAPSSDDDEDGLDAPPVRTARPTYAKADKRRAESAAPGTASKDTNGVKREDRKESESVFKQFARPKAESSRIAPPTSRRRHEQAAAASKLTKTPGMFGETDKNSGTKSAVSDDAATHYAKYKADKEKKQQEQKRKAKAADEIPTFLF
ncbi:uncharacterized protein LTR77_009066 [Saxophila tyrrhenica]|uniref:Uncharacterized protein n=1 Tax=Saxophila tyrrhenica TaxID=1690608 RepID=A0AAV9P096_9PEZI|nr:hypothetical protein LTR77_009066 [Saxophila tyrrhenica]